MQRVRRYGRLVGAKLDGIVHETIERTVTRIKDGVDPPRVHLKGPAHLNTNPIYMAFLAVQASVAYGHRTATHHHRSPPKTAPPLVM